MKRKRNEFKTFRALSKKQKILIFGILLLVGFLTWLTISMITVDTSLKVVNILEWPEPVNLKDIYQVTNGKYAVAVDGNIVSDNSEDNKTMPTASTAKMILALAVMQKKPFNLDEKGETIKISEDDYNKYIWYVNNNGSYVPVRIGEEISQYDALLAVLLTSSNNLADTLANWAFGSIDEYRNYATNMLHGWGINNTTIGEDASGYHDSTVSTPEDLAKIGRILLQNPVLAEIVNTKSATIPVAGEIQNTNYLLGKNNIIGVKTGYIGDTSGYCLVTGYKEGEHIVTTTLLGADTRENSFSQSLAMVSKTQEHLKPQTIVSREQVIGYYDTWWAGNIPIRAQDDFSELIYVDAEKTADIIMQDAENGVMNLKIANNNYQVNLRADEFKQSPSLFERLIHVFGWEHAKEEIVVDINSSENEDEKGEEGIKDEEQEEEKTVEKKEENKNVDKFTNATSKNCTIGFGALMLINPNFTVEESFISQRRGEMVSISTKYGIKEGLAGNGDNLLDAEAAVHINDMVKAYQAAYPGHTLETRSCFRSRGTNCGRLCAATGASDHHTGLTCDLLDPVYGTSLDTDTYNQHVDWQWLRANSYKYGFIDRFPEVWAGGSMDEPLNVDGNGTTGLFETWHYRYVGNPAATEIATGKYNNGKYDSLEHYLKARGMVTDLKNGKCK